MFRGIVRRMIEASSPTKKTGAMVLALALLMPTLGGACGNNHAFVVTDGSAGGASAGSGGTSGADGSADATMSDVPDAATFVSCAAGGPGLDNCGILFNDSCCLSLLVSGGSYNRSYAVADGGAAADDAASPEAGPSGTDPATVSDFRLDKYDVTVGRFRQFVRALSTAAGGAGWRPAAGSGKHAHLNGGLGLLSVGGPADAGVGYELGWVASDDARLVPTDANLMSCGAASTWNPTAAAAVDPINCVNWWEAYAFCIWDGGFLPSEAEWEYAAAGGNEQLAYPWGSTAPGTGNQYAIYDCNYDDSASLCPFINNVAAVGVAWLGVGRWGQLDLVGNEWQWNRDLFAAYVSPCTDCVSLGAGSSRTIRGGAFDDSSSKLHPTYRGANDPSVRNDFIGIRCARAP
jgi:formylglycine-generating enzyme